MRRRDDVTTHVLELVDETHALDGAGFRARALAHLAELLPHDGALFLPFDADFARAAPPSLRAFAEDPRYQRDLAKAFAAGRHHDGGYVDTEVFSARERDRLPFFRDLIRPQGVRSMLVVCVNQGGTTSGVVHLARHDGPDFTWRDFDAVRPLLRAIGALHRGHCPPPARRLPPLTAREREVAELAAQGYQNLAIALTLGTSPHTVRHQLEAVYRKCGVGTRAELAARLHPGGPVYGRRVLDEVQRMLTA